MIDQINAYNAYGPRPDLTQAQIVQGRADAQTTQAFLADHPGLVSVSIAKSYSSMLTSLINDL
ncbi:MAG: hypothetical protein D6693_10870 [Planctomycetota bacterium]|nr:MAG: hypothetical protein D6693_10870 [Planctomycetota bacterium]